MSGRQKGGGKEADLISQTASEVVFEGNVKDIFAVLVAQGYIDTDFSKAIDSIEQEKLEQLLIDLYLRVDHKRKLNPYDTDFNTKAEFKETFRKLLADLKPELFVDPDSSEILSNDSLYNIKIDGCAITIDKARLTRFLERNRYIFLNTGDLDTTTQQIKNELENALERDLQLLKSLRNKALPIYNPPFELLEIKLESPFIHIENAVHYLHELVVSKSNPGSIFAKISRVMRGPTKGLLFASHTLLSIWKRQRPAGPYVVKLYNSLVEHFWNYEVGRPVYMKGNTFEDNNLIQDDFLLFPNPGDPKLRLEGSFPRQYEFRQQFMSCADLAAQATWATLRQQIFGRQKMQEKHSIVPLPTRKKEGYWVVIQVDYRKNAPFLKVHIPWEVVGSQNATYQTFSEYIALAMSRQDQNPLIAGFRSLEESRKAAQEDIFYDSPQHKDHRSDRTNFADADVRIVFKEFNDQNLEITKIYFSPETNTGGMRTPTVLTFTVLPSPAQYPEDSESEKKIFVQAATSVHAHAFIDGQGASEELEAILREIRRTGLISASGSAISGKQYDTKSKDTAEIPDRSQGYEFYLGTDIETDEDSNEDPDRLIIADLYRNFSSSGETARAFKEKYKVPINQYVIFNWALMLTLGIDHVHFLEKDGEGLSPVPHELPHALRELLRVQKRDSGVKESEKNQELIKALVNSIARFDAQRKATRRSQPDEFGRFSIGAGSVECLKVAAGPFRPFLTGLASLLNREANNIATNSFLVSYLTLDPIPSYRTS